MARVALVAAVALLAAGCGGSEEGSGATGELVVALGDGVHAIDLESGEEREIGPAKRYGGAWSPTGTKVATGDWSTTLVTEVATDTTERFATPQCGAHAWSPDETLLACEYSEPWTVSTFDPKTGEVRRLTDPSVTSVEPAWSPDSRSIAYSGHGLIVMGRDGAGTRSLVEAGGAEPTWSPDGRLIAYVTGKGVRVVGTEGGDSRVLLDEDGTTRGLAWSPDGRFIAVSRGDGDFEIFVVDVASGEARNLTHNEGVHDQWPVWSPDSRHLAYLSDGAQGAGVHVVAVDGGEPSRVVDLVSDQSVEHPRASDLASILHWFAAAPG